MTKNEICVCGHAGRDHNLKLSAGSIAKGTSDRVTVGTCLVAGCEVTKHERMMPQPDWVTAEPAPQAAAQTPVGPVGVPGIFI
jgi:hypothetical protein